MGINEPRITKETHEREIYKVGFLLIGSGILLFLDQYLKTSWLSISIPAILGAIIILYGFSKGKRGLFIAGWIVLSVGSAFLLWMGNFFGTSLVSRFGQASMAFALCWFFLYILFNFLYHKRLWWVLLVAGIVGGVGYTLLFTPLSIFDFTLFVTLGVGIPFIIWGFYERLFGLVIAGLIVTTSGLGIYFGWNHHISNSGLIETGTMLVWFALGWLMITVCARFIFNKFVWWPIIPGGIIGMVGLGLYLGGGQGNTTGFISNTGSIALILFGLYLILLKFGMRK